MSERGFEEVYQLDGGIATYGEAYGDDGLWEGSLYVFDDRIRSTSPITRRSSVAATSAGRDEPVVDCGDVSCVRQMVRCAECASRDAGCANHSAA